ncbi:MAG TPA: hypothetical protein VGA85_07885 [Dehalococcoidales bacterium]
MATAQATEREFLCQLIKEYSDDPYCLELIQFFGWHPNACFSGLAILHALSVSGERRYVEKALRQLIDKGVVKTYSENNIAFYRLTDDKALHQAVLDIARLDWGEWQVMLRQSYTHLRSYSTRRKPSSASAVTNS